MTTPRVLPPRSYEWSPPPPPGSLRALAWAFVATCLLLTFVSLFVGRSISRRFL